MVMKSFTVLLFLFSAALMINSCGTPSHSANRGAITLPSESDSELYLIPIEFNTGTTMGALSRLRDYPFTCFIPVTDEDRVFFEDMISKTKRKKHFQQKLVFDYALMYTDPSGSNHNLVVTNYRIIDLSNRIEYRFRDECQQQVLLEFIARLQQYGFVFIELSPFLGLSAAQE